MCFHFDPNSIISFNFESAAPKLTLHNCCSLDDPSYVLQRMNNSATFYKQPNWMYFYFSGSADVNANPNVLNGSSFYFDNDCHYPNW